MEWKIICETCEHYKLGSQSANTAYNVKYCIKNEYTDMYNQCNKYSKKYQVTA